MLKLRPKRIRVGISPGSVVVTASQGLWRQTNHIVAVRSVPAEKTGVFQYLCDMLSGIVTEHGLQSSTASLVISDALMRQWLVEPPSNVSSLDDLRAAAASRFQSIFGESPVQWEIRADWQSARPFLAAGLPQVYVQALNTSLNACRLQAESICQQTVVALNRWGSRLSAGSWLVLYQDGRATILVLDGQAALAGLRQVQCGPQEIANESSFTQFLQLQAMLMGVPLPPIIQIPDLIMELAWLRFVKGTQPQFRVLQKALPKDGLLSSGAALALAGA